MTEEDGRGSAVRKKDVTAWNAPERKTERDKESERERERESDGLCLGRLINLPCENINFN